MDLEIYHYLLLVVAGICSGFINVVAGGGSLFTLPLMIFMGLPPAVANGSNRIGILGQNIVAVARFNKKGIKTGSYSIYLGVSALLGSIGGALFAIEINEELFNRILSIVMVVVAILIFTNQSYPQNDVSDKLIKNKIPGIITFFFIGIYGGFLHAGVGFLIMLTLVKLNKITLVKTNAIKVTVALIYTLSALAIFIYNDSVDWIAGLTLAVGTSVGGWLGSTFTISKGDYWIKRVVLIVIAIMAIKLWLV